MTFTYPSASNRLESVTDQATATLATSGFNDHGQSGTYAYDANGNLQTDPYKQLTINYNYLNLPENVSQTGGGSSTIDWLYAADGTKLRKSAPASGSLHLTGTIAAGTYQADDITTDGTVVNGSDVVLQATNSIELQAGFETQNGAIFTAEIVGTVSTTDHDYVNGIEYRGGVLEAIYHAQGRIIG